MVSSVRRDVVRAGLVAKGGAFSRTCECLAFFASGLAPTKDLVSARFFVVAGLALSPAGWLLQKFCMVAGNWDWPRGQIYFNLCNNSISIFNTERKEK